MGGIDPNQNLAAAALGAVHNPKPVWIRLGIAPTRYQVSTVLTPDRQAVPIRALYGLIKRRTPAFWPLRRSEISSALGNYAASGGPR
jgi:hypothetical protein